jgi:hypothetical protein
MNRMKPLISSIVALLIVQFQLQSQTFGPNSPAAGSNITGTGTNAWGTPGSILSSNDGRSTITAPGLTNYIQASNFGFNLTSTDVVTGIRLEVEKREVVPNVTLLNPWVTGTTRPLSAGANRCMIVFVGFENTNVRDITTLKYGNIALTQLAEVTANNGSFAKIEVWYMLESNLVQTTGTSFVYSLSGSPAVEYVDIFSSAVYQNVDQLGPFNHTMMTSSPATTNPLQLSSPLNTLDGSMSITGIFCGNPPSPAQALGNATAYAVNTGFAELIDYHAANSSNLLTGCSMAIATKTSNTINTVQPTFTFTGTPNRQLIAAISLRRGKQTDMSVRLRKATGAVGSDRALTTSEWPTADTYVTYGGATDLWGTTWTYTEINQASFGAMLSARVQSGSAQVDHFRVTVYTTTVLPIELLSFSASRENEGVRCNWITATEKNTDYFALESSRDGINFHEVYRTPAAGNSNTVQNYDYLDPNPGAGTRYYRLKNVDIDGQFDYSDLVSVDFSLSRAQQIYPNPTQEWATVLTDGGFDEIVVTDSQGQVVDRVAGNSLANEQQLNLYNRPDGVYFVCVKSHGQVKVEKLVKTSRAH